MQSGVALQYGKIELNSGLFYPTLRSRRVLPLFKEVNIV